MEKKLKLSRRAGLCLLLVFVQSLCPTDSSRADTLRLKDGTLYRNVVVLIIQGRAAVIRKNGRVKFVPLKMIRRLRHSRISWKTRVIVKTKIKTEVKTEVKTEIKTKIVRVLDREAMARKVRKILARENAARKTNEQLLRQRRQEALLRSGLLPGLGQYHLGHKERGVAYMGIGAFLFVNFWRNRIKFNTAQSEYDGAVGIPASPGNSTLALNYYLISTRRDALETAEFDATRSMYLLATFWVWNVLEHLVFPLLGSPAEKIERSTIKVSWLPDASASGRLRVGISLRF